MIYYLKRLEIRAIVHNNEAKRLGITDTAHPSANRNFLIQILLPVLKYLPNRC